MHRLAALVVLAACRHSSPAASDIAADARPIVDAWAQAMGGRELLAKHHTHHARGKLTKLGLEGTSEVWLTSRGELRRDNDLQGIRELTVVDGVRGWTANPCGHVIELDGPTLHDVRDDPMLLTYAILLQGRHVGRVTRSSDHTLVLSPTDDDRPITIEIDPSTHLPRTFARREAEHTRTIELADWRQVYGLRTPWSETVTLGDQIASVWKIQQLDSAVAPASTFAPLADRADDVQFTVSSPVVVPLDLADDAQFRIDVSINGSAPMRFVLDTGGPTLIDTSRVAGLGLTPIGASQVLGINGLHEMAYLSHVNLGLAGVTITDQVINTTSIAASFPGSDPSIAGFLGFDFFSRFVVELDPHARQVRLYDRSTYHHAGSEAAIPLGFYGTTPAIETTIEPPNGAPISGRFLIDTGCRCDMYMTAPFTEQHQLLEILPNQRKVNDELVASLPHLVVGSHKIPNLMVVLSRARTGLLANPDLAGNIGTWVLSRGRAVLDYNGRQMWFDKAGP